MRVFHRVGIAKVVNRFGAFVFIAFLVFATGASSPRADTRMGGAKRVALLIANAQYPDAGSPLSSSSKDAAAFADELRLDGFDVDVKQDVGKIDMRDAINAFTGKITQGSVALLYFNGYGIQVARQSYLIPVNAQIWSEQEVLRDGVNVDGIVSEMSRKGATVKVVIIDASRRNPFERRFRPVSEGLASINAPDGTLAMLAAAPGKVTADGTGDVSLFMGELLKEMRSPDISAEEALAHTRIGVSTASNGTQVPWIASSLIENFSFGNTTGAPVTGTVDSGHAPPKASTSARSDLDGKAASDRAAADKVKAASGEAPKPLVASTTLVAKPEDSTTKPKQQVAALLVQNLAPHEIKAREIFRDCADCPDMIALEPGSFTMGSSTTSYTKPTHKVTVERPFAIGRTPVTFDDWDKCIAGNGCKTRPNDQGWGGGQRPAINVSWQDAKEYIAWLSQKTGRSYRLPSEVEWEYAARGGASTPFYWGQAVGVSLANCLDCGAGLGRKTVAVSSFQPNGFGLYDMGGNVAQWVEDCWNENYRGAPKNASPWLTGDCSLRVLRGGSFGSTSINIKPTARFRYDFEVRYYGNGFRLARDLP